MWTPSGLKYVRRLGQGGTARVHLLEDTATRERVSLKLADSSADAGLRRAVVRETTILSDIEYPGLPRVLDSGSDGGRAWYTYRHIEGRPLRHRNGPAGRDAFDGVARGLLAALSVLHDLGWVHYDVSPDNVLVERAADWKTVTLIDLGHVGRPGRTLLGTPGYMAPEILRGEPGGPKSDLYSAGITLIEYALGERLFVGQTQREVADSVAGVIVGIRTRLSTTLGDARADLLVRLADPDPSRRPADAWSALEGIGDHPEELVRATFEAVLASGLPEIGAGDQARADLAAGLKGLAWEAGSANAIADRTCHEIGNPRFELARFLAWLVTAGRARRTAGAWLLERMDLEDLSRGFDRSEAAAFLAGLSDPSREALLLLAAAAEYRDEAAVEWLAHQLIPELSGLRGSRRRRLEAPAYTSLLRSVADADELDAARLRAADLLTDESLRPARLFLRLRAGKTDDDHAASLLIRIARQGRLRCAGQIAGAVEERAESGGAVDDRLLVAVAWARAELRDWEGCRRILNRVEEADTAVRLLAARAAIQLDGCLSWPRGEIPRNQSGEATLARISAVLQADQVDDLDDICRELRRLSPFETQSPDPDLADVLRTLSPLAATPSPLLAHSVLSITSAVGRKLFSEGDIDGARRVFETGRWMAEASGLAARAARFENNLANCLVHDGQMKEAAEALERLAHRREEMGDTMGAITVWGNLGVIRYQNDETDSALVSWERQAALIQEAGQTKKLGTVKCRIACALQEIGSWGSAREAFESSIRLAHRAGDRAIEALSRENLTALLLARGDVFEADAAWRDLDRSTVGLELAGERRGTIAWLRARIDLEYGRAVLGREETLRLLASPDAEPPVRFALLSPDERMEILIRNAMLIGEHGDYRDALPEDPSEQLELMALLCALPELDSDADLLTVADRLPEGVVTSDVAQATAVFGEILVLLEAERGRSPGQLVQQVHELSHRSGLPGLLWHSHLAMGLKDLRRGSLRESAWGFSTALRLFREC
ncbi:MAG: serine/threonine-protein kinase, partial [Planctomycetota bacterium]